MQARAPALQLLSVRRLAVSETNPNDAISVGVHKIIHPSLRATSCTWKPLDSFEVHYL